MTDGSRKFARALTNRARAKATSDKALKQLKREREKRRAEKAALCSQTADGLAPAKRAALLAAQKRSEQDPRAKAQVEQAEVMKRVRDARAEHGIGVVQQSVVVGGEVITDPDMIPMSVAQRRARKRDK